MSTSKKNLEWARIMLLSALDLVEDVYDDAFVGGQIEYLTSRASDNIREALSDVEKAQRMEK